MNELIRKCIARERLRQLAHTHAFHTSHSVAHVAYFCAVMAEGHGIYAMIGGVMVIYQFIVVIASED